MYRSSPFRSTLNTGYITGLDMCKVCTEAVHSGALWTRVTLHVWTCVKYVPKQSIPEHFEHGLHYMFGHVYSIYRSSPFRSTLNTGYITLGHSTCVVKTCQFHGAVNTSSAKTTPSPAPTYTNKWAEITFFWKKSLYLLFISQSCAAFIPNSRDAYKCW